MQTTYPSLPRVARYVATFAALVAGNDNRVPTGISDLPAQTVVPVANHEWN